MIRLVDVWTTPGATAFLYDLLAERKVVESISHKRHPSFEEHEAFVYSRPYLGWYIIADGEPLQDSLSYKDQPYIGTCYITHYREVGIWLMPQAKGKGAGRKAIEQLLAMYPGRVFTNTAIHNEPAFAFYTKVGFRHCANMLEHDNDGIARHSDSSGQAKQHAVATESAGRDWGDTLVSLDPESRESCQEC